MLLAPVLIFGWFTGRPLGVAGAAISSLVAVVIGVVWLGLYFRSEHAYLHVRWSDWRPQLPTWVSMLKVGLPAGAEFALMAFYLFLIYTLIKPFGAAAQAGFGIGMRIVQAGFMPVVALGFSVAPVAGQNFGARRADRVRETFRVAAILAGSLMLLFAVVCRLSPGPMVSVFSRDPEVVRVGTDYLRIVAWNFVASGLVFVTSSMFQAMGHTIPALITSFGRIVLVAIPAILMARLSGFELWWLWYLSVASVTAQMVMNLLLLRREFRVRLRFEPTAALQTRDG
jgi:Na+-driven multidrug efflux pump